MTETNGKGTPGDLERTAQHWDDYVEKYAGKKSGLYWYEIPEVLRSINRSISGDPSVDWSEYTVRKYFSNRLPLKRCLSLGSGAGQLERDLAGWNVFLDCDAYDVAGGAVERAVELARAQGFDGIHYSVADINQLKLPPGIYDAVWIYGAMHHFEALEPISGEIAQCLAPGGLLVVNEYVGPARFQFPERQKELANACLQLLPKRYRLICPEEALSQEQPQAGKANAPAPAPTPGFRCILRNLLKRGDIEAPTSGARQEQPAPVEERYRETVGFPSAEQVTSVDPSEAPRSDEILKVLEGDFEIIEKVEWGGNIVQFLLAGIACNFSDDDPASVELIKLLFQIEKVLLQCGEIKSDFAYIVARPKSA